MTHIYTDLDIYTYNLPESAIAQEPVLPHDSAKMLVCNLQNNGQYVYTDLLFSDMPDMLTGSEVFFFNDTKVYNAKVFVPEGELLVYAIHNEQEGECLFSDGKHFKPGCILRFSDDVYLESLVFTQDGIHFRVHGQNIFSFLEKYGRLPLPPYISYSDDKQKRYQTIFARSSGSVAAPTASLHFTPRLLQAIEEKGSIISYQTLHVGLGTFKPVYEKDIHKHRMHPERMLVDMSIFEQIEHYKQDNLSIIAVGTTMARYLETLQYLASYIKKNIQTIDLGTYRGQYANLNYESIVENVIYDVDTGVISLDSRLFIYPGGITWKIVDQLITNFHVPKSTLLMLVSSFMGYEEMMRVYQYALDYEYRFYSFGDGMWIQNKKNPAS